MNNSYSPENIRRSISAKYKDNHVNSGVSLCQNLLVHEIRNVFHLISTASECFKIYLAKHPEAASLKNANKHIKDAINRGIKLINIVEKLAASDQRIEKKTIDALSILHETVEYVRGLFKDEKVTVKIKCEYSVLPVRGSNLLQNVFENLIVNGIKHNDSNEKEILVNISKKVHEHDQHYCFEFVDNGTGISPDTAKNLFNGKRKKSVCGGMGLGLQLVKSILDQLGGNIQYNPVKQEPLKGSIFTVLLPFANKEDLIT